MNLIEGVAKNGVFTAGGLSFALPGHLADWDGPGIYGVRPEDVRIREGGEVPCVVGGVERLGSNAIYHLETNGHWIRVLQHRSDSGADPGDRTEHGKLAVTLAVPSAVIFRD
ncbi:MAG: TOBE domain-containing protein [Rhodospirillaceae bacterium]|nr:TOBE domain-containing protein [Rhodospirillaceae bacterium]